MTAESKVQYCTMWSDEAAEIKVCQNECVDIALTHANTRAYSTAPPRRSRPMCPGSVVDLVSTLIRDLKMHPSQMGGGDEVGSKL